MGIDLLRFVSVFNYLKFNTLDVIRFLTGLSGTHFKISYAYVLTKKYTVIKQLVMIAPDRMYR